ncbi:transcriptional regulator NanR [compost metagenome]
MLGWQSEAPPDKKLIADLMELRQTIEPLAARLAATRAEPQQVAEIREAFEAMAKAQNQASYIEADLRFHGAVVRSCDNQFIQQLETALSAVWKTSFQASSNPWGPDAEALALHRSLLHSIEARDPQAAEAAVLALIARAVVRINHVELH